MKHGLLPSTVSKTTKLTLMHKQIKTLCILCVLFTLSAHSQPHQFHHPNDLMASITAEKNPGKKIYQSFCANCHDVEPLIQLNAPKFRHTDDWALILKQTPKQRFQNVSQGLNAMPARGGCFECSDELLKQAIDYMLPKKKTMHSPISKLLGKASLGL
tara:strand:- start:55 stop:528 length:474 start_codon:yes stop_codon:yes gene_type:complete